MIETLINTDKNLFLILNSYHNAFFDSLMYLISDRLIWLPLYLTLLILIIKKHKKESIWIIIAIILCISLADSLSVTLFKNTFMRLRPSHNPEFTSIIHLVNNYRGGSYGFISSHASNVFALGTITSFFLYSTYKIYPFLIFFWALTVSYSRIYLGVHYPGDIIGGAVFGVFISIFIYFIYKKIYERFYHKKDNKKESKKYVKMKKANFKLFY